MPEETGADVPLSEYARGLLQYLDEMDADERAVIDRLFELDRLDPLA